MKELNDIKEKLRDNLQQFISVKMDNNLRQRLKQVIIELLIKELQQEELFDYSEIKLEITFKESENISIINPKNLFTLLLLNGYYIPPRLLVGVSEYSPPDMTAVYGYDEVNGPYCYNTQTRFRKFTMGDLLNK